MIFAQKRKTRPGTTKLQLYSPVSSFRLTFLSLRSFSSSRSHARFTLAFIPEIELVAALSDAHAAADHAQHVSQNFSRRIHPQFAPRCDDRLPQNFEAPQLADREAKINFFADEQLFVETADLLEIFAGREQEGAC